MRSGDMTASRTLITSQFSVKVNKNGKKYLQNVMDSYFLYKWPSTFYLRDYKDFVINKLREDLENELQNKKR